MNVFARAATICCATLVLSAMAQANPATPDVPVADKPLVAEFVVSDQAQMIDIAGPWEVLSDTTAGTGHKDPDFVLYTVAETRKPVHLTGGMTVTPDYTFDDAPPADYVFVGKQGDYASARAKAWLVAQHTAQRTLVSICTGAFWLGDAGLLDHKRATTHHNAFPYFRKRFPDVQLVTDARFVQSEPRIFTSGGLTAGIDLALHLVELRFGRDAAEKTAVYMEYRGKDWMTAGSGASAR